MLNVGRLYAGAMITVEAVALDDPRARALWDEQQAELFERYGEPDIDSDFADHLGPDGLITSVLALGAGGEPVGTGLIRWSPYDTGPGSVEVKRLYVRPEHRGHGHSRVIMGALEATARRAGAVRIVLETGTQQPEAIALYEGLGYARIKPYGAYKDAPDSVCFAQPLATRVLVLNGTIGAGKTSTAAGCHDVLTERGARSAYIDGDYLCQAEPANPADPFNQELLFANLAAVGPVYRRAGYGLIIVARVVEDPDDRARYSRAFGSAGLAAEVAIARVTAPEDLRMDRIRAREPEGYWQNRLTARTVELEDALDSYGLDDVVIENTGRPAKDTAEELLAQIGW